MISPQETTLKNYNSIKFKPEMFKDYLLSSEVGFSSCETIDPPNHNSKGKLFYFVLTINGNTKLVLIVILIVVLIALLLTIGSITAKLPR